MLTDFTHNLNWWQKVLYYIAFYVLKTISFLPLRVLYVLSDGLYLLIYRVVGYRRKIVDKNLRESFPQKTLEERKDIEQRFYHFFCDYIFETVKLTSMSHEEMLKRVKYKGLEHISHCLDDGHSIAVYIGHYCNWEWLTSLGLYMSDRADVMQVYHILEEPISNALMLKVRSGMKSESVAMQVVLKKILEEQRTGRNVIMGFASDQVPLYQATRHWLTFLNHEGTLVVTGTEIVAKRCNMSCVYFDITRPRRGYYEVTIIPMVDNPKDSPNFAITDMYFHLLETTISRNPEYWLWTHNRWKRRLEDYKRWKEHQREKNDADTKSAPSNE